MILQQIVLQYHVDDVNFMWMKEGAQLTKTLRGARQTDRQLFSVNMKLAFVSLLPVKLVFPRRVPPTLCKTSSF